MMITSITSYINQAYNSFLSHKTHVLRNPSHIIYYLGLLGFYWYALTIFMGPDGHLISTGLLILAFLGYWMQRIWSKLKCNSLFWMATITTFYVLVRTLIACLEIPENASIQMAWGLYGAHISGLSSLLLLPWIYEQNKYKRFEWAFILIIVSYLCNMYLNLNWTQFSSIIIPQKEFYINWELGMNPNTAGLLGSIILLGLSTIGISWLIQVRKKNGSLIFYISLTLWIVVLWILLFTIIGCKARSVWLALMIVLIPSILLLSIHYIHKLKTIRKQVIFLIICIIFLFIGTILTNKHYITKQFYKESKTIKQIASVNFSNLPQKSIGKRISLWKFGLNKIAQKPFFGWGPGTVKYSIQKQLPEKLHFKALHSAPLQIAFQFGLIGVTLFLGLLLISLYELLKSIQLNILPFECSMFVIGCIFIYLIKNLVSSTFHHEEYRYIVIYLGSIVYYCQLKRKNQVT